MGIIRCFKFFKISKRFDDPLDVGNDPKRSFEVIFLNFKRHFHIRAETEYEPLNMNLFYKLFDLNCQVT